MKLTFKHYAGFAVAAALVIFLWIATWVWFDHAPKPNANNSEYYAWRGTFGDMFGAVNALFSAFAVIGVVWGVLQQRIELFNSIEANKLQKIEDEKKTFDVTFFNLLTLFIDTTNQIDLTSKISTEKIRGKDTFRNFIVKLKRTKSDMAKLSKPSLEPSYQEIYNYFYEKNNHNIGHYFRLLYNIYKYIDGSHIDNKEFYSDIIRAQLSDKEVALMFYNGLSINHGIKFKQYIEKYKLLKHLKDEDVIDLTLKDQYALSAFDK